MSWSSIASAAIPAAVGLGTAYIGAQANKQAAQQTADALGRGIDATSSGNADALAFLREGRDQANQDLAPYREAGLADYNTLRGLIGTDFRASPGYEFSRGEGIRAIDQAASARGMLGSGARLRELTRYGTGVADQEYQQWLNRVQALSGVGQTATGQAATLAASSGGQQAQTTQQGASALSGLLASQGQAQAQGTVGQANALLGGVNQGVGLWSLLRGN